MIKVKNTRIHKYTELEDDVPSFEQALVAEGKLVLLPGGDKMSTKAVRLFKQEGPEWFTPILISETEKIEEGDHFYFNGREYDDGLSNNWPAGVYIALDNFKQRASVKDGGIGFKVQGANNWYVKIGYNVPKGSCFKVLAMPEHFSPKHLQAIVDGKIKDGDRVLVECESFCTHGDDCPSKGAFDKQHLCNVAYKVNLHPHITLYPTSKTAEDYKEELRKAIDQGRGDDWGYNEDAGTEVSTPTFDTEYALEAVMEVVNRIVSDLK